MIAIDTNVLLRYLLADDQDQASMEALFQESKFRFENSPLIWRAVQDYRKAEYIKVSGKKKQADFSDALVVNKARWLAQLAGEAFEGMYSFDQAAQHLPDVRPL